MTLTIHQLDLITSSHPFVDLFVYTALAFPWLVVAVILMWLYSRK